MPTYESKPVPETADLPTPDSYADKLGQMLREHFDDQVMSGLISKEQLNGFIRALKWYLTMGDVYRVYVTKHFRALRLNRSEFKDVLESFMIFVPDDIAIWRELVEGQYTLEQYLLQMTGPQQIDSLCRRVRWLLQDL